jgi:DNA-directed RNA polymerase subunit RPC12/RpoP
MRYRCVACGIEFATIEQLAAHKQRHQAVSGASQGVLCLGCGQRIPLEPHKLNYSGPLTCPHCQRTMTVVTEDGEIVIARLG